MVDHNTQQDAAQPAPIQSGELAELRKLAEAATPGEWTYDENMSPFREAGGEIVGGDGLGHADVYTAYDLPCIVGEQDDDFPPEPRTISAMVALPDARFIAAANPAAILRLMDRVAVLEARQERDRAQLVKAAEICDSAIAAPTIHAQEQASSEPKGYARAVEIRNSQGWKINEGPVPILYTDTINGDQVCRDDVWLCKTEHLTAAASGLQQQAKPTDLRMVAIRLKQIIDPQAGAMSPAWHALDALYYLTGDQSFADAADAAMSAEGLYTHPTRRPTPPASELTDAQIIAAVEEFSSGQSMSANYIFRRARVIEMVRHLTATHGESETKPAGSV